MNSNLRPYVTLLETFCNHEMEAAEFEKQYLSAFKADESDWADDEFEVLDELFAAVDAFCADSELRDDEDLDEDQLRDACKRALSDLLSLES